MRGKVGDWEGNFVKNFKTRQWAQKCKVKINSNSGILRYYGINRSSTDFETVGYEK